MTINIESTRDTGTPIAIIEKQDGIILACNHDGEIVYEDIAAIEFDQDSMEFIPTGTERVQTCGKCGATFDTVFEEWSEPINTRERI